MIELKLQSAELVSAGFVIEIGPEMCERCWDSPNDLLMKYLAGVKDMFICEH